MNIKETFERYKLDYMLVVILWIMIFWGNFSNFVLVDYSQSTFFDLGKILYLNNFSQIFSLFEAGKLVFALLGILPYLFSFSILAGMFVSLFFIKKMFQDKPWTYPLLFSFIFMFNPFVYSKIMIGQVGVLLAYLMIPVSMYFIFQMIEKQNGKNILKAVIAVTFSSLFSMQFFVFNCLFSFLGIIFFKKWEKKYLKNYALFVLLLIFLNAFWLQSFFSNTVFSEIDSNHESFFAPKQSEGIPAVAKILGLSGFWREGGQIDNYEIFSVGIYYIFLVLLIVMMLIGYMADCSKKSGFFFSLFWIGLILGTGASHPYIKPFFDFLFSNIPLFNGFRDSHKFAGLIALAYAYFIPHTIINLKKKFSKFKIPILLMFVIFVLAFSFPLINIGKQIKPVIYPREYYDLENYFSKQKIEGYVIYLPFENYLTYSWSANSSSDGRISVPINRILREKVIVGSDKYEKKDELKKSISNCLINENASCLEDIGVEYVIRDKCAFFPSNYSFLKTAVYENSCVEVHKLANKKEAVWEIPMRFLIGAGISIVTFMGICLVLILSRNRQE